MEKVNVKIKGVAPLIVHNGQLANPLYHYSKELKSLTGKRKKTDDDLKKIAKLEWFGGLYVEGGKPIIPGVAIESMLVNAAKRDRLGKLFKAGLFTNKNFPIIYDGPKDLEKLWKDEKFRLTTSVVVKMSRIIRTRPIFPEWQLETEIVYHPNVLNEVQIMDAFKAAGDFIGLCEWRPKYGRFEIVK